MTRLQKDDLHRTVGGSFRPASVLSKKTNDSICFEDGKSEPRSKGRVQRKPSVPGTELFGAKDLDFDIGNGLVVLGISGAKYGFDLCRRSSYQGIRNA